MKKWLAKRMFKHEFARVYRRGFNDGMKQLASDVRTVAHQVGVIADILETDLSPNPEQDQSA